MNRIKKSTLTFLCTLSLFYHTTHPVVVQGSTSASDGKAISATAFQFSAEKFWVAYATGGASQHNISSFAAVTGTTAPSPTAFVSNYSSMTITNMAINSNGQVVWTTDEGSSADKLYVSEIARVAATSIPNIDVSVPLGTISADPLETNAYAPDLDAKIRALAVSATHAFVAVNAQLPGTSVDWLSGNSSHVLSYQLPDAGDTSTAPSLEDSNEDQLTREVGGGFAIGSAIMNKDAVVLEYAEIDSNNKRLYVGTSVTSALGSSNGARSLVIYKVDSNGDLSPLNIKANPNASWGVGNATLTDNANNLVGVLNPTITTLAVHHLKVMKTTSSVADVTSIDGMPYLIICGGNGQYADGSSVNGNRVWALPLVASQGNANDIVGTLADKTVATHYSQADGSLTLTNGNDRAAQVGQGTLPDSWPATLVPTQMLVHNDAVFVSGPKHDASGFPGGIYYSRCRHKKDGRIHKWSKWKKAASNTLGASSTDGGVQFFGTSQSGKLWAVGSTDQTRVRRQEWHTNSSQQLHTTATGRTHIKTHQPNDATSIHMAIESNYSIPAHYATFYRVVNGVISTTSANLKETTIPDPAFAINDATFVPWTNQNYWVVGTQKGVAVYMRTSGDGATNEEIATANLGTNDFFSNASWQYIYTSTFVGTVSTVTASHSSGALYVLVTSQQGVDSIYRIKPSVGQNIRHASAAPVLIAQASGNSGLPNASGDEEAHSSDIRNISDIAILDNDGTNESLIIATDVGAFVSVVDISGTATGTQNATRSEITWKGLGPIDYRSVNRITLSEDGHANLVVKISTLSSDHEEATIVSDTTNQHSPITSSLVEDDEVSIHVNNTQSQKHHWANGSTRFKLKRANNQLYSQPVGYPSSYKVNVSSNESAFSNYTMQSIEQEGNGVIRVKTTDSTTDIVLD